MRVFGEQRRGDRGPNPQEPEDPKQMIQEKIYE